MRWLWVWSITGRRRLPGSSKIRRSGTWARAAMWEDSIRSSFRVPCTAWRPICTKSSFLPRVRVRADLDLVEEDSVVEAASPVEVLAAAAEARFELDAI